MKTINQQAIKSVAIYSRKSKYTGKGESIANQITECREYLRTHFGYDGENIYVKEYEDEGYSGGNTNRPHFQEMLTDIKNRKYDSNA